ncbi:MAG: hypothetical protein Q4B26_00245 [Eubacteriales bacterium]|nr:hypothetical protein [Eubacteriales bacterium]
MDDHKISFAKILAATILFIIWYLAFYFLHMGGIIGDTVYLILTAVPVVLAVMLYAVVRSKKDRL